MPVWKQKYRPFTLPSPIGRVLSGSSSATREHLDRADRVVREPDRAGEDVRRAAREHTERGVRSGDAGGDLVQRAVAAEPDDDVDATSRGILREPGRMAPPVRLDERHFVPSGQLLMDHDGVPRGDRRRERVDDEQQSQGMRR